MVISEMHSSQHWVVTGECGGYLLILKFSYFINFTLLLDRLLYCAVVLSTYCELIILLLSQETRVWERTCKSNMEGKLQRHCNSSRNGYQHVQAVKHERGMYFFSCKFILSLYSSFFSSLYNCLTSVDFVTLFLFSFLLFCSVLFFSLLSFVPFPFRFLAYIYTRPCHSWPRVA